MEATIKSKIKPFHTPNYVLLDTGRTDGDEPKVPVSMVDEWTLDALCNKFRRDLFAKAGKREPPTQA